MVKLFVYMATLTKWPGSLIVCIIGTESIPQVAVWNVFGFSMGRQDHLGQGIPVAGFPGNGVPWQTVTGGAVVVRAMSCEMTMSG